MQEVRRCNVTSACFCKLVALVSAFGMYKLLLVVYGYVLGFKLLY